MPEVSRDNTGSREDTLRFIDLVGLFGSQAMIALGKVINPATGKAEKNLGAAQLFVDMLDMLERKTRGNLTPDEAKILKATLTDLRLMYAEEAKAGEAKAEAPAARSSASSSMDAEKEKTQPAPTPTPATAAEPTKPASDESKVKFHKSYGEEKQ